MHYKDISGQRFGKLIAVSYAYNKRYAYWHCMCDCGNTAVIRSDTLKNGNTESCGCLAKEWTQTGKMNRKHGMRKHTIYKAWIAMKQRCNNPKNKSYKDYGGRGIKVCDRWLESFDNFRDDMFPTWQESLTLDRVNNDGNYEPGNVKWSTWKEQGNNRRSKTCMTS